MADQVLRKELIKRIVQSLRDDGICKTVSSPKGSMTIVDENGVHHKVVLRRDDKQVWFDDADVAAIVDHFVDVVSGCVAEGKLVRVVNFGVFSIKKHKGHTMRDAETNELVRLDPSFKVKFTPGRKMRTAERLVKIAAIENGTLYDDTDEDASDDEGYDDE